MRNLATVMLLATMLLMNVSGFVRRAARVTIVRKRMFAASVDSLSVTEVMRRQAIEQLEYWIQHSSKDEGAPIVWSSRQEASAFLDNNIDTILFDCDGVLYRGLDCTPEAPECLSRLMKKGKKLFFVTNNAGQNRQELRDKLADILDCPQLTREQMISSSYSCAQYLKQELLDCDKGKRVHVIGTQGLCDEISSTGFSVSGGPSTEKAGMSRDELAAHDFDALDPVDAVVVGLDTDFNYRKLCIANVLLQRNPNALFVATNEDAFDLVGADARHLPGNGSLVKALEHASQRKAVNVGKPSVLLTSLIQRKHGLDPSRTIMIGDRLDTDIRWGVESGILSALVLTGCVTAQDLIALGKGTKEEPIPDIILPYMGLLA